MEIKKPELSAAARLRLPKLVERFKKDKLLFKQDVEQIIYPGCEQFSHEREARAAVEILRRLGHPINSCSGEQGYRYATDYKTDTAMSGRFWNECKKRAYETLLTGQASKRFYEEGKRRGY